jgi:hypothetical protein
LESYHGDHPKYSQYQSSYYVLIHCLSIYDLAISNTELEATKAYEVASTAEYNPNPPT